MIDPVELSLYAALPQYLLDLRTPRINFPAWPFDVVPAVIEAARSVGLVNRGGDLQILALSSMTHGESQMGVWVRDRDLQAVPVSERPDLAAKIALDQFRALGGYDVLVAEAMAGWGLHMHPDPAMRHRELFFEWRLERPR